MSSVFLYIERASWAWIPDLIAGLLNLQETNSIFYKDLFVLNLFKSSSNKQAFFKSFLNLFQSFSSFLGAQASVDVFVSKQIFFKDHTQNNESALF